MIAYSPDGINWSPSSSLDSTFAYGSVTAIAWNGSLWLAGGNGNPGGSDKAVIAYSSDGINWSSLTSIALQVNMILWFKDFWILGCQIPSGSVITGYIANGSFVILSNISVFSVKTNSLATNGSMLIAGGDNGLAWSQDAILWTLVSSSRSSAVAWNGSVWIATGITGDPSSLNYSYDGKNWLLSPSIYRFPVSALVTRNGLPRLGQILGTPYTPAVPTDWPSQGAIQGPTTIGQALDLVATCFRANAGYLTWES